jgi:cytoskeletal protein RodZ
MGVGSRLREAREERQFTLAEVAQLTRISSSHLKAIETENYDRLPEGIFGRGYVRAFAAAVGLNPETLASEFRAEITPVDAPSSDAGEEFRLRMDPIDPTEVLTRHARGQILAAVLLALSALALLMWVGWHAAPGSGASVPAIRDAAAVVFPAWLS